MSNKCFVTGLDYFMDIEHPERGLVPTYGGPELCYTEPYRFLGGCACDWMRDVFDNESNMWMSKPEVIRKPTVECKVHKEEIVEMKGEPKNSRGRIDTDAMRSLLEEIDRLASENNNLRNVALLARGIIDEIVYDIDGHMHVMIEIDELHALRKALNDAGISTYT